MKCEGVRVDGDVPTFVHGECCDPPELGPSRDLPGLSLVPPPDWASDSDAVIDERDQGDGRCCGLKPDHEGCCAYFCSMCTGTGRCGEVNIDDLGCSCGFCDGSGYCSECSGQGWFNEEGEPCWVGADEWGVSADA